MELYITISWAYNCKTKDGMHTPIFLINVIKSCHVDLDVRYEGGWEHVLS